MMLAFPEITQIQHLLDSLPRVKSIAFHPEGTLYEMTFYEPDGAAPKPDVKPVEFPLAPPMPPDSVMLFAATEGLPEDEDETPTEG